ncbi:MAG: HlyD family efflux transporter periplasmic adaptor subunit [Brevundimonas sp.]
MATNRQVRLPTLIILASALAVVVFIAWASIAKLDQITRAPGRVIPSGRTQVVQSEHGGSIAEILVREGDTVRRGQVLVRLDSIALGAALEDSEATVASQRAKMARIQAELFSRPLAFPPEVGAYPEFVSSQRQLYLRRRQALESSIDALQAQLRLARQELELNRPLVESGDVSRSEMLRMERGVADLAGQIAIRRSEYLQELQAEYAATEEELAGSLQELTQRRAAFESAELVSPSDGIVVNLRVTTIGGVVAPGDEVLQVVPTGDELIVEARVPPQEIAFIRVGQEASIKFDAYDSAVYGSGLGRVTYVSADTLEEPTPQGPRPYYRVNLSADTSGLRPRRPDEQVSLQPGMTATVEILTGDTTVFRYLTKPILKTASEAFGER